MPDDTPPVRKKRPYHRKRHGPKGTRSTAPGEHVPVMLAEVLTTLNLREGQTVADCTLGFAGHARELLRAVGPDGHLVALDLDGGNLSRAGELLSEVGPNFTLAHGNFAGLAATLAAAGFPTVDAILADLGMSSMQVDDHARGFSFMRDGPLDMRMDPTRGKTAADLLNALPEADLTAAFATLGDEPAAATIAAAIVARREATPFARTPELREVVEAAAPVTVLRGPGRLPARKQRLLPVTRVFQALRILVNRELANLEALLRAAPYLLNPGGTLAIISFHSGEDRIVKASLREGLRVGTYAAASDTALRPGEAEKVANPRGRSAKLRWARTPEA